MKISSKVQSVLTAAFLALAALGATGVAQAGDNVYWSVGVSSPGVQMGVSNARPLVVQAPVYTVYQQPAPVYVQPTVYVRPAPVYVQPAPVYISQPQFIQTGWDYPERHHGWWRGHHRHGHWDQGRHEGGSGGWEHHRR